MDLNEPLGMRPPPTPRRRTGLIAACAVGSLALAGFGVFLATADPHGGEPYAVTQIPPAAPQPSIAAATDPTPTGSLRTPSAPAQDPTQTPARLAGSDLEGGVRVVRGTPAQEARAVSPTGPLVIDVSKALDEGARHKPLAPFGAPAAPAPAAQVRVAIFVSGMGLSEAATRTAIATMPAAVDLAFVPYGDKVTAEVAAAKAKGHEILLQLPMETSPGQRPGPHALRPNEPAAELRADLDWLTDRFSGYAGVTNLLGGPVTSNAGTMGALLKIVAGRGLFYVDDGTSPRSVASSLAATEGVMALKTDVVLDATNDPTIIRANLDRLVAIARRNGQAIGMASGLPDHLSEIARYAADLGGQGVVLAPVSALAGRDASVATAR